MLKTERIAHFRPIMARVCGLCEFGFLSAVFTTYSGEPVKRPNFFRNHTDINVIRICRPTEVVVPINTGSEGSVSVWLNEANNS
jgi:hypothetical protein